MERQMNDREEQVLRTWDENFTKKERETFRVRPLGPRSRDKPERAGRSPTPQSEKRGKFLTIERVLERDASFDDGEGIFDTSVDSMDEDVKKPLYTTCPLTGKKLFRIQLDVQGFEAEDIKVKVSGNKLLVFARHKESEGGRRSTTEFCKKLKLPEDIDASRLECLYKDSGLFVEAPVRGASPHPGSRMSPHSRISDSHQGPPLNIPVLKEDEGGRHLHLFVEVGRVFQAGDVVVKLKGKKQLVVTAVRKEDTALSSLDASITREFTLPEDVCPDSLRAGLNMEGVLTVQAKVLQEGNDTL